MSLSPWPEVQALLPPLSTEERESLKAKISNGVLDIPIFHLPDGRIVDGHHRWELSDGKYPYLQQVDLPEKEAFALALSLNTARRQLSREQKQAIAEELRKVGCSQEETARVVGVARNTISVWEGGATNVKFDISCTPPDNRIVIPEAHKPIILARYEAGETQTRIAADYKVTQQAIQKKIKEAKLDRKRARRAKEVKLTHYKQYRVIYADPPWKYGNKMPADYYTEQAHHYPLMTVKELCAFKLPIKDRNPIAVKALAENNAVLFLWVTSPILEEAFDLIKAWGFKYKSSFVWDKIKHNMGHYNSVRHEFLLICTRGSCQPDVKQLFDSVVSIERTEHSKKPEYFRTIIDTIYPIGNRIELFARRTIDGWDAFGDALVSGCQATNYV